MFPILFNVFLNCSTLFLDVSYIIQDLDRTFSEIVREKKEQNARRRFGEKTEDKKKRSLWDRRGIILGV